MASESETQRKVGECVLAMRTGQLGRASVAMQHLTVLLQNDLASRPALLHQQPEGLLRRMIEAQERNDMVTLADLLEFELLDWLAPKRSAD